MWKVVCAISLLGLYMNFTLARYNIEEFIRMCKGIEDVENIESCMKKATAEYNNLLAMDPVPRLNLPVIDPANPGDIDFAAKNEDLNVNGTLSKIAIKGLSEAENNSTRLDYEKGTFFGSMVVPSFRVYANYEMRAELGELILNGKGTCWMEYLDLKCWADSDFFVTKIGGKPRVQIKNFKFFFDIPTDVKFRFNNLINGDDILDGAANAVLFDNRYEIISMFRGQMAEKISAYSEGIVNGALKRIDIDDMAGAVKLRKMFNDSQ